MRSRLVLLLVCCGIYILGMFHRNSPGVLAEDIMAAFGVTPSGFGVMGSGLMVALGLMQLPSGVLSDTFGSRRVIFVLTLVAGLGALWFALAPGFDQAVASRFLVGVGISVTVPIYAMLAENFSSSSYSRAVSVVTASGGLGTMLAAPPLVMLTGWLGWRGAVLCFGVLTLVCALIFRLVAGASQGSPRPAPAGGANTALKSMLAGVGTVLKTPAFWPLCLWQSCMTGSFFMLASLWWVPYFTETAGLNTMVASTIMVVVSVGVIILQPALAWFTDVKLRARKPPIVVCTLLSVLAALTMVLFCGRLGYPALVLQSLMFTAAILASPQLLALAKESFPPRLAGTALGCTSMVYPLWTAVLQVLFGVIVQTRLDEGPVAAYATASLLVLVNAGMALAASLFMKENFGGTDAPAKEGGAHAAEAPVADGRLGEAGRA